MPNSLNRIFLPLFVFVATLALAACGAPQIAQLPATADLPLYRAFGEPQPVTLRGYQGDAMEPFITRDGRYLLFNNRNDPRIDTRLHWAERVDDSTFDYLGEMAWVNTKFLEGVPSLDRSGNLYFVSTRSYRETRATLYRARFDDGKVSGIRLVDGVSRNEFGMLIFDAEISADGDTLFLVDGRFSGGPVPDTADIDIAVREGEGFRRLASGHDLLKTVNTDQLEFAPAISEDLRELFFTRLYRSGRKMEFAILRVSRPDANSPFGQAQRIASIKGLVEAPALSADGSSLYFHRFDGARYAIYRVTR